MQAQERTWRKEQRNLDALDWLSTIDSHVRHQDLLRTLHSGSGEWLLEDLHFQNWKDGVAASPMGLWCHGKMGCGKSAMISLVVDWLQHSYRAENVAIAFIYCDWQDIRTRRVPTILGCLLRQLVEHMPQMPAIVSDSYDKHRNGRVPPSVDELIELLMKVSSRFDTTFILIDALDECAFTTTELETSASDTLESVLGTLLEHASNSNLRFRLLVTSRFDQPPRHKGREFQSLQIVARDEDLKRFSIAELTTQNLVSRWTNDQLPGVINQDKALLRTMASCVVAQADGIFLLLRLHLFYLKTRPNLRQLKQALTTLPTNLATCFGDALTRIKTQPDWRRKIALHVLSWTMNAWRPLTIGEIQHALATEPGDTEFAMDGITPPNLLIESCAGLVIFHEDSGLIRLANASIKQHLELSREDLGLETHLLLTRTCVTYLLFHNFRAQLQNETDSLASWSKLYCLLPYAAEYWGMHAKALEGNASNQLPEIMELLRDTDRSEFAFRTLYASIWGSPKSCPTRITGLHLAALFGLQDVVANLILEGYSVNGADRFGRTPLFLAAVRGHVEVVKTLLNNQAIATGRGKDDVTLWHESEYWWRPPWARDDYRSHAIEGAAEEGHFDVVRVLCEGGAPIDRTFGLHGSPLEAAVFKGNHPLACFLLGRSNAIHTSALSASIYGGRPETFR
ncbi:hypothetical protein K469DRAFT_765560, partial [Zopfia rhizophila CBS 207.26]